jgi:hypothetical protein
MRFWSWILALGFSTSLAAAPTVGSISKNADPVGQYKKFELSFPVTTWATNLYDPAQIDVHVTFTSPGGQSFVINAFPYQAFTRSGSRSGQTLSPTGALEWRCHFPPSHAVPLTQLAVAVLVSRVVDPSRRVKVVVP